MDHEPIVFVVDDDPAMRESLRWLIESVGISVTTFADAGEFLDKCDPTAPGCLVLDVRMPGMSGLDLQETLEERGISTPIVVITGYGEVPMAVRALKHGAVDFIEKPFSDQQILDSIRQALEVDRKRRSEVREADQLHDLFSLLTPREQQVMDLVVMGKSNKEAAKALGVSPKTIEVHRAHLMDKLRVRSLAELIRVSLDYRRSRELNAGPVDPAKGKPPVG